MPYSDETQTWEILIQTIEDINVVTKIKKEKICQEHLNHVTIKTEHSP